MPPATVDFTPQNPSSRFSDKPTAPRSKPRLGKTRRRHVARANPGLNPSEPCLVDLNRATDDFIGLSDGFVFGKSETKLNNLNLNVEMNQSNTRFLNSNTDCRGSKKNDESGRFLSKGFVSGAESVSGLSNAFVFGPGGASLKNPNLNVKIKQSNTSFSISNSDCKESNKNDDFGKDLSGCFVFGAARSCYDLKNPESISGLSNGFMFGASENGLDNSNFNVEMKQNNDVFSTSNSECKESNKNDDFGKFLSGGFVFGTGQRYSNMGKTKSVRRNRCRVRFGFVAKGGVLNSDSNSTKEALGEKMENLTRETKGNAKISCKRGDGMGFVFSGNWCELGSTSDKTRSLSNDNGGKSVPVDSDMKPGVPGEVDSRGFVFGSSSVSGFQKVFENVGGMKEDTKLDLQKEKVDNVFVFGSINKGNSFLRDHNKLDDEMNKPNAKDYRNNNSVDNDIYKSGFFANNKPNFVFGSNFSETYAPGVSTSDNLSDDMKKLSVNEPKETGQFDGIRDPFTNSCAGSDPVFVFGSSGKPFCSNTGQSGTTKIKDAKLQGPEKTDGIDIRINNDDKTRKTGGGVSDESIKLGRLFETFEEKHPTDANEKSSNDTSVGVSTPKLAISQAGPDNSSVTFECQVNDDPKLEKTFRQNLFSSGLFHVEGFSIGRVEEKDNFSFMSTPAGVGSSATGFRTLNVDASCSFAENSSTSFSQDLDCNEKGRSIRNRKCKKLSRKFRKVDPSQRQPSKNSEGSQQNAESPGHFSPMDFSPYQNDQCAASTNATCSGLSSDESAKKEADTGRGEKYFGQAHEFSKNFWEQFAAEYAFKQAETVGGSPRKGQIYTSNDDNDGVADAVFPKFSNSKQEENESRNEFCFPSSTEGNERNTGFSPISKEDNVSATKFRNRKKYRIKVGFGPNNIDTKSQVDSGYLDLNQTPSKEQNAFESQRKVKNNVEGDVEHSKQPATTAAQNSCEKWRIRGNQAYEKGNSSKAEEYYTKGINSFIHKESPDCSTEPLVLCYSNRAAARMLCGRLRDALADCVMADSLDPSFQKVQLRAANCHLALGEIEEACQYFSKCLESKGDVCLDRRLAIEAASGLQKAQKLASCINHCAELLRQKTSAAANSALESISVVFPTSSYSEKLLELKGEALLRLQRYKEVIQLCEQTLVFAEKNFAMAADDNNSVYIDVPKNSTIRLWRWRLMSKSYFYLGKLEVALDLLEKQEVLASSDDSGSNTEELSFPFAATVRELLHQRTAGNGAFQSGRYTEAVEHYSAAVSSSIESRPFAAICFCNRAAAQQALGQLSDAISDCSIAIALDGSYSKAGSRRATLHEKIRDYASATSDLERLLSLLKEQSQDKNCGSAIADSSSGNNVEELRKARRRLSSIEENAKKGLPLDHYLILGVKSTDEASEIKKAYRKAALRHHPDKAAQFLARGDNGDDGRLWKEICEEIQKDADRLFKTIGEAYAVLSDPNKRSEYDLEEELRNARKDGNRNRDSTGPFDSYSTPFKNRSNNRYSQESWKTYGYSRSQW